MWYCSRAEQLPFCNVTFRDKLFHNFWYTCLCSYMATCSLLDRWFQFVMQLLVQCVMWRIPPMMTIWYYSSVKIGMILSHKNPFPPSKWGEMCSRGFNIPDALRQRLMFPVVRVCRKNALKTVHLDGAIASCNKIVVYCNNFIFLFLNYFPKMLFRRRAVLLWCNFCK